MSGNEHKISSTFSNQRGQSTIVECAGQTGGLKGTNTSMVTIWPNLCSCLTKKLVSAIYVDKETLFFHMSWKVDSHHCHLIKMSIKLSKRLRKEKVLRCLKIKYLDKFFIL